MCSTQKRNFKLTTNAEIVVKIMEMKEIVELMLKSSDHNPYTGMLSKKDNLVAAIDLAKLCKDFSDKGQMDEAMNIPSEKWVVVISELEGMLLNWL